jgi:alkylhydroperoxidase/carboxymuconolactone decarboxylase family protein YurZ
VVADDTLALYQQPDTRAAGVWPVLDTGWFPIESAADGHAWQWSEQDGIFWLYQRPGLTLKERQIATLCMLMALGGKDRQVKVHMRAGLRVGITEDELRELVIQLAAYAGFPAAINAQAQLNEVLAEESA